MKINDVVSFRGNNYQIVEIQIGYEDAILIGRFVEFPAEKKIDINFEIEIEDDMMKGWEKKYLLDKVEGLIVSEEAGIDRQLIFHFRKK